MKIFWKALIIANFLGLIFLSIYSNGKNQNLEDKVSDLDEISRRLIKEAHELKAINRELTEVSNQLKFRIERLEFESGKGSIENVELLQYENINPKDETQELENAIPPVARTYRFNMENEYCDIARESIITLVASGLGELAYICNNK